eukprot:2128666-Amphidinium_carterae.1
MRSRECPWESSKRKIQEALLAGVEQIAQSNFESSRPTRQIPNPPGFPNSEAPRLHAQLW